MNRTSIILDFYHSRCGCCKVALHDELATICPICGAVFDQIVSNHVGLVAKLQHRRESASMQRSLLAVKDEVEAVELVGA